MPPRSLSAEAWLLEAARLRPLVRAVVRDDHLTEDVLQETWLAASNSEVVAELDAPARRSWLRTVARRLAAKAARRDRRSDDLEQQAARPEAITADERPELLDDLRVVLEELGSMGAKAREAVCLRYLDGLDGEQVAARMGCNPTTARVRLHRGLDELRERLRRRFGEGAPAAFALLGRWTDSGPAIAPIPPDTAPTDSPSGGSLAGVGGSGGLGLVLAVLASVTLLVGLGMYLKHGGDPPDGAATSQRPTSTDGSGDSRLSAVPDERGGKRSTALVEASVPREEASSASFDPIVVGAVEAATREPIPDVELLGFAELRDGSIATIDLRTDHQGVARLPFDPADLVLIAIHFAAPGRAPEVLSLRQRQMLEGPDRARAVPLARGSTVGGVVLDDFDRPVEGARVTIERQRPGRMRTRHFPDSPHLVATTDASGRWQLPAVDLSGSLGDGALGSLRLRVECEGFATWESRSPRRSDDFALLSRELELEVLSVRLATPGVATLSIVDGNGAPVAGAWLYEIQPTRKTSGALVRGRSDALGQIALTTEASSRDLRVEAAGYAPAVSSGLDRAEGDWTIELERGSVLRGVVTDASGAPVAGAHVSASVRPGTVETGVTVSTDADGNFELEDLPARTVAVAVEHALFQPFEVELSPLGGFANLTLVRRTIVTGTVVDMSGAPIAGARIESAPAESDQWRATSEVSDDLGNFTFIPTQQDVGRRIRLDAVAHGFKSQSPVTVDTAALGGPIRLRLIGSPDLRLRLVDPAGNPLPAVQVRLCSPGAAEWDLKSGPRLRPTLESANSGPDGTVAIARRSDRVLAVAGDESALGALEVELDQMADEAAVIEVVPTSRLRVALHGRPGLGLRLTLVPAESSPFAAHPLRLVPESSTSELGQIELTVPAGGAELRVEILERSDQRSSDTEEILLIRDGSGSRRPYRVATSSVIPFEVAAGAMLDLGEL
ncbi:sigma-70 family RNA polymerase sigma factor [Engelhardtia mirabilis]|uniref:sigma-70 family RNA polymerase sigma factor n=1 Tax=Engelhardtia mirabilis TaxID=2528011 RepID=UPI003AF33AD2